jgi:AraC family transcriptional activator of pobA
LKRYLDRKRADYAQRALIYADANVSLVADQMGFPDPFTFSRFFKRVTGENPRDYRKRMR